jgi:glycosyltransferase involved in cell wall biosynthesis
VTCLCLTRNRRQWLPQAIRLYQAQTYPNRELLILADGDDVRDIVPDDPSIRLLQLEGHAEIGTKRNLGCSRALGDVIAVWDDDDYSSPDRLSDQVGRLQSSGKSVTGYRRMRFTNGSKWWEFSYRGMGVIGTSLCFRRDFWALHPFPAKQIGEDFEFAHNAAAARELDCAADAGEMMYATVHSTNTSPRRLQGDGWKEL